MRNIIRILRLRTILCLFAASLWIFAGCSEKDSIISDEIPTTGSVIVECFPKSITPTWHLEGPDSFSHDSAGDTTFTGLEPGDYTITWGVVSPWSTPGPNPRTKVLVAGETINFVGSYYTIDVLKKFDSVATSQRPEGVIFNGTSLCVSEVNDDVVYEIDPNTGGVISILGVPGLTHDLGWDGTNLWVTSYWADPPYLRSYDLTGQLQTNLDMPSAMAYPTALAYDSTLQIIWTVNTNSSNPKKFWKIDAATGAILESWDLSTGVPYSSYGMCMDDSSDYLWVIHGNQLLKISIAAREIDKEYVIPSPAAMLTGVDKIGPGEFWLVTDNVSANHIFRIKINE